MQRLGAEPFFNARGLNLNALWIFASVMGVGHGFIPLVISTRTVRMSADAKLAGRRSLCGDS